MVVLGRAARSLDSRDLYNQLTPALLTPSCQEPGTRSQFRPGRREQTSCGGGGVGVTVHVGLPSPALRRVAGLQQRPDPTDHRHHEHGVREERQRRCQGVISSTGKDLRGDDGEQQGGDEAEDANERRKHRGHADQHKRQRPQAGPRPKDGVLAARSIAALRGSRFHRSQRRGSPKRRDPGLPVNASVAAHQP